MRFIRRRRGLITDATERKKSARTGWYDRSTVNTDPQLASPAAAPNSELSKSLLSRHVVMISIGGIIGAGLFVGSSAAIASVGPAVIFSYCLAGLVVLVVMRMLSEMASATPGIGSFTE